MEKVTTCLAFKDRAEEAVKFYVSVFKNSKIESIVRYGDEGPLPKGKLLHATFQLDGGEFTAMDGGESFSFAQGTSLVATCETQKEIDELWEKLSDGGEPGPCGWLTDRYGVSWQVVPAGLEKIFGDPKSGNSAKAFDALLKMGKIDIRTLEEAYRQPATRSAVGSTAGAGSTRSVK